MSTPTLSRGGLYSEALFGWLLVGVGLVSPVFAVVLIVRHFFEGEEEEEGEEEDDEVASDEVGEAETEAGELELHERGGSSALV